MKPTTPARCFINGVYYDQTVIQLRAEAEILRDPDTGEMIPYRHRASAEIETTNPALITRLYEANFTSERISVSIKGEVEAEASDGFITTESRYASNEVAASFKLEFGSPIRFAVPA